MPERRRDYSLEGGSWMDLANDYHSHLCDIRLSIHQTYRVLDNNILDRRLQSRDMTHCVKRPDYTLNKKLGHLEKYSFKSKDFMIKI